MGFLNPLFLLAGAIVLVPVILHLFYRQESKIFTFPAIRYLLRTERDHARQIRTQQLLLLLLRVTIVVLLVLVGARIHFPGPGGSHEPTALALVIDNSLSTTIIQDGRRLLDSLKAVARQSVSGASHDDVIWVVRAGTPWEPAVPGGIAQALSTIDATAPSHAAGALGPAIERARALVGQSDLPNREVHVFTDLQATAFSGPLPPAADIPVVVFGAPAQNRQNRGIERVAFGGGLPPLAGSRTEAAVGIGGGPGGDTVGVRLYIGGQVRAAARAPSGTTVRLPAGPFPAGRVEGHVEIDADPLTADDRRYFSFAVRDPTPVALLGTASIFLTEALAVLEEGQRISRVGPARAATLISVGGEGLERRGLAQSVLVAPHPDPAQLPALNRRLAEAGIPFRFGPPGPDGARVTSSDIAIDLGDLVVRRFFRVEPVGPDDGAQGAEADAAPGDGDPGAAGRDRTGSRVSLSSGDPWLVAGEGPAGPYILLASPLDEVATSLPVSAAMIPLLEWAIERWSEDGGGHRADHVRHELPPPRHGHVGSGSGGWLTRGGRRPALPRHVGVGVLSPSRGRQRRGHRPGELPGTRVQPDPGLRARSAPRAPGADGNRRRGRLLVAAHLSCRPGSGTVAPTGPAPPRAADRGDHRGRLARPAIPLAGRRDPAGT